MLISLANRFVFVATLKTASTAIENRLRPYAEIALVDSLFGKHWSIGQIRNRFDWLLDWAGTPEFLTFAVIRDPIEFMLSLYNSHCSPAFADDPSLHAAGKTFSQFLDSWLPRNAEQARPQHQRLLDNDGRIGVDYVISYEKLTQGLDFVARKVGIGPIGPLPTENKSYGTLRRADLRKAELDWIRRTYRQDFFFRERLCDRLLDPADKAATFDLTWPQATGARRAA